MCPRSPVELGLAEGTGVVVHRLVRHPLVHEVGDAQLPKQVVGTISVWVGVSLGRKEKVGGPMWRDGRSGAPVPHSETHAKRAQDLLGEALACTAPRHNTPAPPRACSASGSGCSCVRSGSPPVKATHWVGGGSQREGGRDTRSEDSKNPNYNPALFCMMVRVDLCPLPSTWVNSTSVRRNVRTGMTFLPTPAESRQSLMPTWHSLYYCHPWGPFQARTPFLQRPHLLHQEASVPQIFEEFPLPSLVPPVALVPASSCACRLLALTVQLFATPLLRGTGFLLPNQHEVCKPTRWAF